MNDIQWHKIRDAAILTTSYVPATILGKTIAPELQRNDEMILDWSFSKGSSPSTSMEIKVEGTHELLYALNYDGQTGNFTVGLEVTGGTSLAKGVIVQDTDAGTTGTLVLRITNTGRDGIGFYDNEALTDTSTGVAVVNGALNLTIANPDDLSFYQETQQSSSAGITTIKKNIYQVVSADQATTKERYSIKIPIKHKYVRISFKGTGILTATEVSASAGIARLY